MLLKAPQQKLARMVSTWQEGRAEVGLSFKQRSNESERRIEDKSHGQVGTQVWREH